MNRFAVGDEVRIDITDEADPDHHLHGCHGRVTNVLEDDAGESTGDPRDSVIYQVALDEDGGVVDVRWRDLRPPFDE